MSRIRSDGALPSEGSLIELFDDLDRLDAEEIGFDSFRARHEDDGLAVAASHRVLTGAAAAEVQPPEWAAIAEQLIDRRRALGWRHMAGPIVWSLGIFLLVVAGASIASSGVREIVIEPVVHLLPWVDSGQDAPNRSTVEESETDVPLIDPPSAEEQTIATESDETERPTPDTRIEVPVTTSVDATRDVLTEREPSDSERIATRPSDRENETAPPLTTRTVATSPATTAADHRRDD
jgi:hypothetical protein